MLKPFCSLPTSFSNANTIVSASLTDVFEMYRALMPTLFASQVSDVPSVAMQMANDHAHLAKALQAAEPTGDWDPSQQAQRLRAAGEAVYEMQLEVQRSALMDILDGAQGFQSAGTEPGIERIQRAVKGILHNVESLGRVLKVRMTVGRRALDWLVSNAFTACPCTFRLSRHSWLPARHRRVSHLERYLVLGRHHRDRVE